MLTRAARHGLELTELGLGVAQFGNLFRETSDEEAASAVDSAWRSGIRYFDTAPHYGLGLSERRLGALLRDYPRDEFVVSSKVGRLLVPSDNGAGAMDDEGFAVPATQKRVWDFSRDGILRSVEDSLTRTGLDHFDILYLHDPDDHLEQAATEGIRALIELREQGMVKAVGAGMKHTTPLATLIRRADIDLVMLAGRYTLLEQGALSDLLPLAVEKNVRVVVAGVYNSGLLSSPRVSPDAKYEYEDAPKALVDRANLIASVCERHGVSLPAAAIAYPLMHPAVVSVVVGSRNAAQVDSNVQRYRAQIPPELWVDLAQARLIPETT
jgi:D-threo-aldose 1-dehydrogenase